MHTYSLIRLEITTSKMKRANIQCLGKFCALRRVGPMLDMVCGEPRDGR